MKKWLEVKFYSPEVIEDDSLHKCDMWGKKYYGVVRFENEHQINQRFFEYFEGSYEMS
jgi:hypothetical protein